MPSSLPEKYYLGHAQELFSFVSENCQALLSPEQQQYLHNISSLSEDAQCLLVRLLARKPRFFARQTLSYAEIRDIDTAIQELVQAEYISGVKVKDWPSFAQVLTKPTLLSCLKSARLTVKTSTPKAQLVTIAREALRGDETLLFSLRESWLVRRQQQTVDYILFLYFGDLHNRLQKFAMRDLGVLRTRTASQSQSARFAQLDEALTAFKLHQLKRDYRAQPQEIREDAIRYLHSTPDSNTKSVSQVRDKLILQVAHDLYQDDPRRAIRLWQQTNNSGALEKWIRASYQHLCRDQLKNELEIMREFSLPAASKLFVEDFYQRKYQGKRTSVYTDMLREANCEMAIDECYLGDVEEGVLQRYQQQGAQAWFTENKLWNVLFGLTLWPILFGKDQTQHTEFDYLPAALKDADFYAKHQALIEERLQLLNQPAQALQEFTRIAATAYGTPTGLFRWSTNLLETVSVCITHSPSGCLARVIRDMAQDYSESHSGYPDLMVLENDKLRFEEVKAPGDTLRPNQLISIERLRQAGLQVEICQVHWATDPNQIYAVVDIETTGGRKGGNAITEIAVVRVQNQEVISEWSTLINPGRPIPAHITRLTGINNQMVASAPVFAEISNELDEQLTQAVFVAHNVGFDYGFIKAAYESIGRKFKKPKYCTVQHARKAFPGLRSYSLGNLATALDLDLKNAHRALNDARATADLLRLIQAES